MTPDQLIAEGDAIAKKCFLLIPEVSGPVVGYWGGTRSDIPDSFPEITNSRPTKLARYTSRRHVMSIDDSLLNLLGIDRLGPVGLFEWESTDKNHQLNVDRDPRRHFKNFTCSGLPLYAIESRSFPPVEALCLHGSERIGTWLSSMGLARHEYWRVPRDQISEYEEHYSKQSAFNHQKAHAIVGGWHVMWPEDDFYIPPELTFIALTLHDAEPWYTVWYSPMTQGCFAKRHTS